MVFKTGIRRRIFLPADSSCPQPDLDTGRSFPDAVNSLPVFNNSRKFSLEYSPGNGGKGGWKFLGKGFGGAGRLFGCYPDGRRRRGGASYGSTFDQKLKS